jgi:hypothetical protein
LITAASAAGTGQPSIWSPGRLSIRSSSTSVKADASSAIAAWWHRGVRTGNRGANSV